MDTLIPIKDGSLLTTIRGFLNTLLESKLVEALYVPLENKDGAMIPALVTDPARLELANPWIPVMPINGARAVSLLTNRRNNMKLAAVLRPCEIRALIELVKLQQACLENVILIGMDCAGTMEITDYLNQRKQSDFNIEPYLRALQEGHDFTYNGITPRTACQMCVQPFPPQADIRLFLWGSDLQQGIPVRLEDAIAGQLQLPESPGIGTQPYQATLDSLLTARKLARTSALNTLQAQMATQGGLADLISACIRCHNCMTVCPICYCKNCLFKNVAMEHDPEEYLALARRKGALRFLSDTLLFHLTRLHHMSASCVSCGMCTSACPVNIPVGTIFSAIGAQVQTTFDYHPGRATDEPLPLVTYQVNEWMEIGE